MSEKQRNGDSQAVQCNESVGIKIVTSAGHTVESVEDATREDDAQE